MEKKERKYATIPVTHAVRNALKTIVKQKKVLGETATYSTVIKESLNKSLSRTSEGEPYSL